MTSELRTINYVNLESLAQQMNQYSLPTRSVHAAGAPDVVTAQMKLF